MEKSLPEHTPLNSSYLWESGLWKERLLFFNLNIFVLFIFVTTKIYDSQQIFIELL